MVQKNPDALRRKQNSNKPNEVPGFELLDRFEKNVSILEAKVPLITIRAHVAAIALFW
jgi:hypothetical protein